MQILKKKIAFIISVLLFVSLLWYLFVKPYDYLVSMTYRTSAGTINQSVKSWSKAKKNNILLRSKDLFNIEQQWQFNDSVHEYHWKITPVNDSTTKVKLYIKDETNSFMNKLVLPFYTSNFEQRTKRNIFDFNRSITEHIGNFKVQVEDSLQQPPSSYCAYISIQSTQLLKAKGMMRNYPILSGMLADNKVELNGRPFIEITNWNRSKDSLSFNFCFPIIKSDSLPQNGPLKYKEFKGQKSLKAVYNGNYITSDRAWYALLDHAQKKGYEVSEAPVEVFYNNPNFGGDELQWTAEIYMPIKQ